MDFEDVTNAVDTGAPERLKWTLALGLLTSIVWVYVEFLRLLSILRSSD